MTYSAFLSMYPVIWSCSIRAASLSRRGHLGIKLKWRERAQQRSHSILHGLYNFGR